MNFVSASAVEKNVPGIGNDPERCLARCEDLYDPMRIYALKCFGKIEGEDGTWQHLIKRSLDGLDSSLWLSEKVKDSL